MNLKAFKKLVVLVALRFKRFSQKFGALLFRFCEKSALSKQAGNKLGTVQPHSDCAARSFSAESKLINQNIGPHPAVKMRK